MDLFVRRRESRDALNISQDENCEKQQSYVSLSFAEGIED